MKLYIQLPSTLKFLVSHKNDPSKLVHPLNSIQHFMIPCWQVQVLHPPQKFERVIGMVESTGLKSSIEITFSGMAFLLNFIKIVISSKVFREKTHGQTEL
jgi:hypothetical protein